MNIVRSLIVLSTQKTQNKRNNYELVITNYELVNN
jgi:hypothetical protein